MTLQNLKYMLEISNSHSFSKAAKNLFVSQSTLSAAVKELESDLRSEEHTSELQSHA